MNHQAYTHHLRDLQLALVRWQTKAIPDGRKVVVVLEGRDGAGKDSSIKRLTEHLSSRATRMVALPKPSDRERSVWFFRRYVEHLPACGELVIFKAYSAARNEMLTRTDTDVAPWWCVATDQKKDARINLMRRLTRHLSSDDAARRPDHAVLFRFDAEAMTDGRLAK